MDLSLLSDAEIRAVDALIRGVWAAGMYVTLDTPPVHGVFAYSEQGVTIRSDGFPVEYQARNGGAWTTRHKDDVILSRPASVAEAFDTWCANLARHVRRVRTYGPPRPAPYALCRVTLERNAAKETAWVIHDTVCAYSIRRVLVAIGAKSEDSDSDDDE